MVYFLPEEVQDVAITLLERINYPSNVVVFQRDMMSRTGGYDSRLVRTTLNYLFDVWYNTSHNHGGMYTEENERIRSTLGKALLALDD